MTLDVTGVEICRACLSAMEKTLETFKLRGINLKDTIQTYQLDLQKVSKQKKADDSTCNARHNSKSCPNNDWRIHLGQFSWRKLPAWCQCWLQHYANTDSFRHKQGANYYSGSKRSSIFKKNSPVERNVASLNRRLDWKAWFLQANLTSTALNTKFENSHVILS